MSQTAREERAILIGDVVIRTIPVGGHPPEHPFWVPGSGPTRRERAELLRRLRQAPAGVLPVLEVCECSFSTPFLDARPVWDLGLGPDGPYLQPPAQRNELWDFHLLSTVLADLARALADLHEVGVAHGDAALMNALVVEGTAIPKGTWVDLGSVVSASDDARQVDAASFVLATALPALLCADEGSSSLVTDLIETAGRGAAALEETLRSPRTDVERGSSRATLTDGLQEIDASRLGDQLVRVGLRMAPAYFLDQSNGDLAVRFLQQVLHAERTRSKLLEEERTRLMYRRFHDELESARTALATLRDYSEELEVARDEAREQAVVARREGDAVAERLDQVLRSRMVRFTAAVVAVGERGIRRVARLSRLVALFTLRRLGTAVRLVLRGDLADFRDRVRALVAASRDRDGENVGRTPVVLQADPWPVGTPLVSVVVVCFNYGAYVEEAIDSVLTQTAAELCEVIVVDGGSDDPETVEKLRQLAADPPPRTSVILRADGRHLVGDNRNHGIERARGRYVACLDADDLIDPRYLEIALYLLERRGYDLVSTTTRCFGLTDDFFGLKPRPDLSDMLRANYLTTVAVFRRALWERAGGFHDVGLGEAYVFEDWKLWLRIAALGARMTNIQAPLFRYRVHSTESLSRQSGGVRDLAVHQAAVKAFNVDVMTAEALAESARRRSLEITVEGAFDNLKGVERTHRPTILLALPFMLIGGAERLLSAVAKHLADAGYRIVVITTVDVDPEFGDSSAWFEEATLEIYRLPLLLRRDYWADFVEYVVETKDVDVLLLAGSEFTYHQLPELRLRHPELQVVDLLFNTQGHVENNRRYADQIDLHLCENADVRDWLLAHHQDEASVLLVESGVDTSAYRPVERRRRLPLRVGFSGRLSEEKAPLAFVDLARMLSDSRFQFAMTGAGPLEAAVRRRASGLSDESFRFLGVVADIRAHLASLDVLVLPSNLDGRPLVVLEALALGVPVIASRVGGLPELVRDGETGFLVEPGDTQEIARHLQRLASDPAELDRLQRSARAFAESNLDAGVMNAGYESALRRLLRQPVAHRSDA